MNQDQQKQIHIVLDLETMGTEQSELSLNNPLRLQLKD